MPEECSVLIATITVNIKREALSPGNYVHFVYSRQLLLSVCVTLQSLNRLFRCLLRTTTKQWHERSVLVAVLCKQSHIL